MIKNVIVKQIILAPYEILVYINEEEDKLVSEIIDDMNKYQ